MASLSGQTPANTYKSLIKTGTNDSINGVLKQLTDGLGNAIPISVSTTAVSMSNAIITGSLQGTATNATNAGNATLLNNTGSAVFATTGSNTFRGSQILSGSSISTGSLTHVGSSILSGSNEVLGNTTLSGSIDILGNSIISGSHTVIGTNVISGSLEVSGSSNFHNSIFIVTGSTFVSGSTTITGSLYVQGNYYKNGNKQFNYGVFYDTTTQSGSANTAYAMKLNTTSISEGVSVTNNAQGLPTRLTFANTGIYNIQFSAQLQNTANTTIDFDIWLAYTGSNEDYSTGQVSVTKSPGSQNRAIASWNYVEQVIGGDYVEIKWSSDASTGQIATTGSLLNPTRPGIPSVLVTATQVA